MSTAETDREPVLSVCAFRECGELARARVTWDEVKIGWTERATVTVRVWSLLDPVESGQPYCLQHAHYWVDWALMSSLPSPCTTGGDA